MIVAPLADLGAERAAEGSLQRSFADRPPAEQVMFQSANRENVGQLDPAVAPSIEQDCAVG